MGTLAGEHGPGKRIAVGVALCGIVPLVAALSLRHTSTPPRARLTTHGVQAAAPPTTEGDQAAPDDLAEPSDETTTTGVTVPTTRKARVVATTVRPRAATTSTTSRRPSTTTTVRPAPSTTMRPTTTTTKPALAAKPSATTPVAAPAPASHQQTGAASWYDTYAGTCAHVTLPRGTIVKVTRLLTGASTTCRVADYGPTIPGRVIDLSKDVFAKLADPSLGVIDVRIEW